MVNPNLIISIHNEGETYHPHAPLQWTYNMFIQCSLIRDTNFRSLSIIEQTSALLDKRSLDIIIIIIMFLIRTVVHQDTFNATKYMKKKKIVQKRIQHGEWYNTTVNCMLTDILSRMENAPSQPPSQPIHIARLRTTMPGTPETNRATRPTMHAKHNR